MRHLEVNLDGTRPSESAFLRVGREDFLRKQKCLQKTLSRVHSGHLNTGGPEVD
jgi:hypothetical protein